VVIDDLYLKRISVPPNETYAISIVDPDAVLSSAVTAKSFQLIAWRHLQIVQRDRRIQNSEFLKGSQLQICWETAASARLPQSFGFLVPETQNHFALY
jgi:hypothetical protein